MKPAPRRATFVATSVAIEDDGAGWRVGFADAAFNPQRYLVLQRDHAPSAEDIALGLAGYHVELDDQNQSCYGGIARFELFADRVEIEFDAEGLAVLGDEPTITIGLALRERQLEQLRGALTDVFTESDCYIDSAD